MLAIIKKSLICLGSLCALLIVTEILVQTSEHSPSSVHQTYVTNTPLNFSTATRNSHLNYSAFRVSIEMNNDGTGRTLGDRLHPRSTTKSPAHHLMNDVEDVKNNDDDLLVEMFEQNGGTNVNNTTTAANTTANIQLNNDDEEDDDNDDDDDEERRLEQSPYIYHSGKDRKRKLSPPSNKTSTKLISYYLPWDLDRHSAKRFDNCEYNNCRYVDNMSLADAVLFRASNIRDHIIPNFYRPKGQRWIFFTSDPAIKGYGLDRPDVVSNFNWTFTYQLHSDYPTIFGRLMKVPPPDKDYEAVFDSKDRQVAWFVSHCPTWGKREQYVERMRHIVQVDVFGKCGNLTCGPIHYRGQDSTECLPMLSKHYKFYLAFENSFCKDYISEKFFKLFQDVDVVPVVRGGFNYKKYLPSGIFVDASDFKTPEALARYLVKLGKNKTEYVSMLKKKGQWMGVGTVPFHCQICQALHTAEDTEHYYQNLKDKFNGNPPECWLPTDLENSDKQL